MGNSATVVDAPQHLEALKRANEVRLARAQLKRLIAAGEETAAEVVVACPWQAQSMSVSELLLSQKRWGRTRSRRILMALGIPENKRLGTLTERQRLALAELLPQRKPSPPERRLNASRSAQSRMPNTAPPAAMAAQ